jgi:hypothetical protein
MSTESGEGHVVSDRKAVSVSFYRKIGLSFVALVFCVGTLYSATLAYMKYGSSKEPEVVTNPADLPALTAEEVAAYRDSVPRTIAAAAVGDEATADGYITFGDEPVVMVDDVTSAPAAEVPVEMAIPSGVEPVSVPLMSPSNEVIPTSITQTAYIEGDVVVADLAIEQPQRQNTTPITATAIVVSVSLESGRLLATVEGEVMDILLSDSRITTKDGRIIPPESIQANDILSVSGQKLSEAPVIASALMQLVGVQEFVPTVDIGI